MFMLSSWGLFQSRIHQTRETTIANVVLSMPGTIGAVESSPDAGIRDPIGSSAP